MTKTSDIWQERVLSEGPLDLVLLPGIGGRLWDIRLSGRSILFQNPDLIGCEFDLGALADLPTRSPQFGFPLWGGEKTWIAPDSEWPGGAPQPVPDSGAYAVTWSSDHAIQMESRLCPDSGLVVKREIELLSASSWTIKHRLKNKGTAPRLSGVWSVMMLDHPTSIGVPGTDIEITGVFDHHSGRVASRPGGVLARCDGKDQFKVALDNPHGSALVRVTEDPIWLLCRTAVPTRVDMFVHGQAFEVFNSGDYAYCEAEWHSPSALLAPGATLSFQQTFHVWSGNGSVPLPLSDPERKLMQCTS